MSLVNLNDILVKAKKGKYAVGAFNFFIKEDLEAIISAAEEVHSPVIVMTSPSAVKHWDIIDIAQYVRRRAHLSTVPVCLHLDHATDYNTIIKAMDEGYSSVMYDGSLLSYEENVKNTKEIVKVAHALNITVEGEIGRVGRSEDGEEEIDTVLSVPEEVKEYVEVTGIDACAIAIGSQHAMQKQEANLDFDRLKAIRAVVDLPLVLHGSSGVVEEELKKIGKAGMQKVNIGTRLKRVFSDTMRKMLNNNKELHNQVKVLEACTDSVKNEVIHKMELLGCIAKA
ncbi:class II fructose-bisphosphate aldolase [Halocella sp. SP3-1]|uniref:class II fructose-bisphosphate aldolase n=1 Tax=Halocella sp. SP3-1 TaxID=2382161 RepID=UPI000F75E605|nr:class II fructose-bisphosphate aldolase [Halocella sp. SP3-1]AZO94283.1 class II fructose-bisphosphate aldolase [Halocella sp. SP3-1]MTI58714.1 class II fructose-bisphosphate aldolase [Bacillota bacterium]